MTTEQRYKSLANLLLLINITKSIVAKGHYATQCSNVASRLEGEA
jgi:hypothetical protein